MMRSPVPFDHNVERWVHYSESLKGRLRRELIWHHLGPYARSLESGIRVLDAGCGLGEMAPFLLERAEEMLLLDFSEGMLAEARRRLVRRFPTLVQGRVKFIRGGVEELGSCVPGGSFHLILCHTLLEYVNDPARVLASLVDRLARGGIISIVTANRFSEAFKLALVRQDLKAARSALQAGDFASELFGNAPKHGFSLAELEEMTGRLDLRIEGRYGVRVFTDYLDSQEQKGDDFRILFELEREAGGLEPYLFVARYLHLVCSKRGG